MCVCVYIEDTPIFVSNFLATPSNTPPAAYWRVRISGPTHASSSHPTGTAIPSGSMLSEATVPRASCCMMLYPHSPEISKAPAQNKLGIIHKKKLGCSFVALQLVGAESGPPGVLEHSQTFPKTGSIGTHWVPKKTYLATFSLVK